MTQSANYVVESATCIEDTVAQCYCNACGREMLEDESCTASIDVSEPGALEAARERCLFATGKGYTRIEAERLAAKAHTMGLLGLV